MHEGGQSQSLLCHPSYRDIRWDVINICEALFKHHEQSVRNYIHSLNICARTETGQIQKDMCVTKKCDASQTYRNILQ